jgi:hypothetical protein
MGKKAVKAAVEMEDVSVEGIRKALSDYAFDVVRDAKWIDDAFGASEEALHLAELAISDVEEIPTLDQDATKHVVAEAEEILEQIKDELSMARQQAADALGAAEGGLYQLAALLDHAMAHWRPSPAASPTEKELANE